MFLAATATQLKRHSEADPPTTEVTFHHAAGAPALRSIVRPDYAFNSFEVAANVVAIPFEHGPNKGAFHLFDVDTGELRWSHDAQAAAKAIALRPNTDEMAIALWTNPDDRPKGAVVILNSTTGERLDVAPIPSPTAVVAVAYSRDGTRLAWRT